MGGQGAKRTNDGDVVADTSEASAGTGNRYGKYPRQGKRTSHDSELASGEVGGLFCIFLAI